MSAIDVTLKAADAATMKAALTAAGLWNTQTDTPITASHQHSLDYAGTMYAPDGTTSVVNGVAVQNQSPLEGVYAFLRCDETSPLLPQLNAIIIDQPATTLREFAGGSYKGPVYYDPALPGLYTE